jgi:DNA repair protein RadC
MPNDSDSPRTDNLHATVEKNEMPRERLRRFGASQLKTQELIAIVLRTGTKGENVLHLAERLLSDSGGLSGLAKKRYDELVQIRGIKGVKAVELAAVLELGLRMVRENQNKDRDVIKSPADAARLLTDMSCLEQEVMRTVPLDTKNRVLSTPTIYRGSLHTTVMRTSELFREAVRSNCAAIIVAHNHPSGDPTPSPVIWRIKSSLSPCWN